MSCVDTANLQLATSAAIYKELTCTLPTPLVERVRGDLPWHHIWPRLQGPSLEAVEVDAHFSLCMASWTSWPTDITGGWPPLPSA